MDIILLLLAKPLDKHGTTLVHITYPPLGTVKADAVPELSPAQHRGEHLALGLCVFMIVRILFSTQILPDLQQSSTL